MINNQTFTVKFINNKDKLSQLIGPFQSEDDAYDYADSENNKLATSGIPTHVACFTVQESEPVTTRFCFLGVGCRLIYKGQTYLKTTTRTAMNESTMKSEYIVGTKVVEIHPDSL